MRIAAHGFAGLKASAARKLITAVPMLSRWRRHKSVIAMTTILALSEAGLAAKPIDARLGPSLRVSPALGGDRVASAFIREIHTAIEGPVRAAGSHPSFDAGALVEQNHFLDLVLKLARAGARDDAFDALIAC